MSKFDRRTVITTGSALVTGSVLAVGSGSADETEATNETNDDPSPPEPSDGWFSYRGTAQSTSAVRSVSAPDSLEGPAWRFDGAEQWDGTVVSDGRVYCHDGSGRIHALDAEDGLIQWSSDDLDIDGAPNTAPVAVGDWLYAGGERLTALDAESGDVRWTREFDDASSVFTPEFAHGTLYVSANDYAFYAIDPIDGTIRWERRAIDEVDEGDSTLGPDNEFLTYTSAVTDDAVYGVIGRHGPRHVVALNPETGETLWVVGIDGIPRGRVAATEDYAFVYDTSSGETKIIDTTVHEVVDAVPGRGAVADGLVVARSENALRAVERETGNERWVHDSASTYGTPAIVDETVVSVLAESDGSEFVRGFDLENGSETLSLRIDEFTRADEVVPRSGSVQPIPGDETIYLTAHGELLAVR